MVRRFCSWLTGLAVTGLLLSGCRTLYGPGDCCIVPPGVKEDPAGNDPLVKKLLLDEQIRMQQEKLYGGNIQKSDVTHPKQTLGPAEQGPLLPPHPPEGGNFSPHQADPFRNTTLWPVQGDTNSPWDKIEERQADYYPNTPPELYPGMKLPSVPIYTEHEPAQNHQGQFVEQTGPELVPVMEKKEPLLVALGKFLENRPDEAIEYLKAYDQSSQDVFLRLLPVLAQMTHKKLDQFNSEESAKLYDQLDSLMLAMRSRTDLVIDRMCFCEIVEANGLYKPMAEDHVFRPKNGEQLGELVQVYVLLRNLNMEKNGRFFEARLDSSVEIVDEQGKQWWYYNFQDRDRSICSQTNRTDHFNNYSFYVPHIPPGAYTLRVQVKDLTRPDMQRIAQKSLRFQVGR